MTEEEARRNPVTGGYVLGPLVFPETDLTKPITMEMSFTDVDPEVLGLLTGGAFAHGLPEPTFALEVVTPIKRKWWQWLLRRPRQYRTILIPHARVTRDTGG